MTTAVQQERERDSDLDEIWCVLDHDERDVEIEDFRSWLGRQPNEKARSTEVRAAISTPCFEYWLLLHFEFTNRPFQGMSGGPSACELVTRALATHLEGYRKADARTYERCRALLPVAIDNAKRGGQSEGASSTNVWELVEKLQEVEKIRRQ